MQPSDIAGVARVPITINGESYFMGPPIFSDLSLTASFIADKKREAILKRAANVASTVAVPTIQRMLLDNAQKEALAVEEEMGVSGNDLVAHPYAFALGFVENLKRNSGGKQVPSVEALANYLKELAGNDGGLNEFFTKFAKLSGIEVKESEGEGEDAGESPGKPDASTGSESTSDSLPTG